jgi:hypothetical protein
MIAYILLQLYSNLYQSNKDNDCNCMLCDFYDIRLYSPVLYLLQFKRDTHIRAHLWTQYKLD